MKFPPSPYKARNGISPVKKRKWGFGKVKLTYSRPHSGQGWTTVWTPERPKCCVLQLTSSNVFKGIIIIRQSVKAWFLLEPLLSSLSSKGRKKIVKGKCAEDEILVDALF